MTRHGKNCTAGAVYTYHEKKRDSKSSGWGSIKARLSKDSIKDFDCCSLTLQPCKDPVVTPHGDLYDRETILEYILHQKQTIAKKLKAYEKQLSLDKKDENEKQQNDEREKVKKFKALENSITTKRENPFAEDEKERSKKRKTEDEGEPIINTNQSEKSKLPSFWVPTLTPQAENSRTEKPDNKVYCPMSGKAIRMKDLISVRFSLAPESGGSKSLISKKERYICPVTHDILGNKTPCVVLKPTGDVVTKACVEKFIKKDDWRCPMSGKKLKTSDIIELRRGGTGYSEASGKELEGKVYGPTLMCG